MWRIDWFSSWPDETRWVSSSNNSTCVSLFGCCASIHDRTFFVSGSISWRILDSFSFSPFFTSSTYVIRQSFTSSTYVTDFDIGVSSQEWKFRSWAEIPSGGSVLACTEIPLVPCCKSTKCTSNIEEENCAKKSWRRASLTPRAQFPSLPGEVLQETGCQT